MAEYMTLLGAAQVQSAARQMENAASEMRRAASSFETTSHRQQQFMDDWLMRFADALVGLKVGGVPLPNPTRVMPVAGITLTNSGAGYSAVPQPSIIPWPSEGS